MKQAWAQTALVLLATIGVSFFFEVGGGMVQSRAAQTGTVEEETVDPEMRRRAARSRWRLERALRRDRYPSALAALNLWRSNALAAGTFDKAAHEAYRRRIYEKSVKNILEWFEVCLQEKWIREAIYCQKVYRLHAKTIQTFDPERYDAMTDRIENRKKEIEAEEQQQRTASSKTGDIPADGR